MILETMLQRLFASLVHGPSMNARPQRSRQRCDWMDLSVFSGLDPASALKDLIEKGKIEFPAKVPPFSAPAYPESEWSKEQKDARAANQGQMRLLKKLREITDDALEYSNDHGESCLAIGFPLISIPPAGEEKSVRGSSRVLAPLLLMPVNLQVRTGSRAGVSIECTGVGAEMLVANPSLIAWLERQTGKSLGEIYQDEDASDPWREVAELLQQIASIMDLPEAANFNSETLLTEVPLVEKLPKTTAVLPSAVLGLFPLSNQSLLRDTRWMLDHPEALKEPVSAFLSPKALHDEGGTEETQAAVEKRDRDMASEWLVSNADPCQANAVIASREARALVVHGPPGTGKSQTILNMIADHLARGERILFVCDKRTALDVVKYRLDAVGLGDLCGVVHDPGSDRKDFYMGLRGKLENLADEAKARDPRSRLDQVNRQLSDIHAELETCRRKLHEAPADGTESFHGLMGSWLEYAGADDAPTVEPMPDLRLDAVESAALAVDEICRRAEKASYPVNPFRGLLGISVADYLARNDVRQTLVAMDEAAETADSAKPGNMEVAVDVARPIPEQVELREQAVGHLRSLQREYDGDFLRSLLALSPSVKKDLLTECNLTEEWLRQIGEGPLDRVLMSGARSAGLISLPVVNQHLAALVAWEPVSGSFFKKLFAGSVKKAAVAALSPLGLSPDAGWKEGLGFYKGLKSRLLMADWLGRATGSGGTTLPEDGPLALRAEQAVAAWKAVEVMAVLGRNGVPVDQEAIAALTENLEAQMEWLRRLDHLLSLVAKSGLFAKDASGKLFGKWSGAEPAADTTRAWLSHAGSIEDLVRMNHSLGQLPKSMAVGVEAMAAEGVDAERIMTSLRRQAVENVLREKLKSDPDLAAIDGDRVEAAFNTFQKLSQEKLGLTAEYVRHLWQNLQRKRLLASTGTQLNSTGSGLRQRLYVRGKKALKLRQMLATGMEVEGGDPIYDLCPVWMASPSTVAQIFPRSPIFNVVIFDEASQCRLEEALPVLMRGERVVIAGDQKQLPPTRFFESALADSGDGDAETAEELFFQQQSEAEDLLSAALNLDVREAYLDVHYRSRNEALIGFSNEHYYGSRLQPIPGHPRNKALSTPIRLHRVDGVYQERANEKEAEAAVELIASLLADDQPPSIGVACFNLTQREKIHDAIAARVEKDSEFARRYEEARKRKGRDSFEGLFVKNLENVQGDERDVMIICTTFGPDPQGKFRRNFGALSQRDGGRRLNVLVTRARDAVHVLTSIPASEYSVVDQPPPGQVPNGRLQLYAYLLYAERLADWFENYQNELEKMKADSAPELKEWKSATPSPLAAALGRTLLERHDTGCHVHWGNEGFCVDVACIHPLMPADVTVGVLSDFSRFHKTPDPIEWDIFRTNILRSQGWELQRLWSPVLFRRLDENLKEVEDAHERLSAPPAISESISDSRIR